MKTIHVIAHNDVDGVICHSIAEMYARKSRLTTIHYFVDYQSIGSALETVSNIVKSDDKVIIADIGFEEELIALFLDHYREIAKKTLWFDHHNWNEKAIEEVGAIANELIINQNLCAAEIIQKRFFPDNQFAKELAYLARAHDFYGKGVELEIFEQACRIQDVLSSGYCKQAIIQQFTNGILWSDNFEAAHKRFQEIMRPDAVAEMENTIKKYFVMMESRIVANITAVFVSEILESKDIRTHLMNNEERRSERDVLIAVWPNGRIAYEVRNETFSEIIDKINVNFGGGGRGLAGGATYPTSVSSDSYENCFNGIIRAIISH